MSGTTGQHDFYELCDEVAHWAAQAAFETDTPEAFGERMLGSFAYLTERLQADGLSEANAKAVAHGVFLGMLERLGVVEAVR